MRNKHDDTPLGRLQTIPQMRSTSLAGGLAEVEIFTTLQGFWIRPLMGGARLSRRTLACASKAERVGLAPKVTLAEAENVSYPIQSVQSSPSLL